MEGKDCKRFDGCNAPLCPMKKIVVSSDIWYPYDEICTSHEYCKLCWIRNQRKIAKKTRDIDTYYTYQMLQQNCVIAKGIAGLDPDNDISEQERDEAKWLKQHPEKRILSEEIKNRMEEVRRGLIPPEKDTNGLENSVFKRQSA
jgi:hypothetical protein